MYAWCPRRADNESVLQVFDLCWSALWSEQHQSLALQEKFDRALQVAWADLSVKITKRR